MFPKTVEINLARIEKGWMHYISVCVSKRLFLTCSVTKGFCPDKSSKSCKQRLNLFRYLTSKLWEVELWLTMWVNAHIILQEVTGHFGVSFLFIITFS